MNIHTWRGTVAVGAIHYYGEAWREYIDENDLHRVDRFRVKYLMDRKQAAAYNKREQIAGRLSEGYDLFQPGALDNAYEDKDRLVRDGIAQIYLKWKHDGPVEYGDHWYLNNDTFNVKVRALTDDEKSYARKVIDKMKEDEL